MKMLDDLHPSIVEIIGEENVELAKIFKYVIAAMPLGGSGGSGSNSASNNQLQQHMYANHLRHRSF